MIPAREARKADLPGIEELLKANGLPTAGVGEQLAGFLVVEHEGRIVASAGVELYGRHALLRSVAVDPAYRGRGLAGDLVRTLLDWTKARNVAAVFLLTTTAADYFRRLGFIPITRNDVPAALDASPELRDGICETAQAMMLSLAHASEGGQR